MTLIKKMKIISTIVKFIIPISISYLVYQIISFKNLEFNIPTELRGWLLVSIVTPLVNSILSTKNLTYWFQKCFIYNHTWNTQINGNDFMEWFSIYIINHKFYSYDSLTKIINNQNSVWWDDNKTFSLRPQIKEIPSGWIIFKYKTKYLFAYFPYPAALDTIHHKSELIRSLTVYSFTNIDWKFFNEDVCNYYYDNADTTKLAVYRNIDVYVDDSTKVYSPLRSNASIKSCFGNKTKEEAWNGVLDFFKIENKTYFKKINQSYKTAFLIHGPSGTGKTELLFQIASYTWSLYQKPVYIINPKGCSDNDLFELFNKIQSGYVLIDEWDLFLEKEDTGKKNGQYPSLNAWLNLLDNVSGEIIFWFTTNNYEKLAQYNDGALVRPGRIDHIYKFDKMTPHEVRNAWKYFNPDDTVIDKYDDSQLNDLTIAKIINNLKKKLPISDLLTPPS